MKRRRVEVNIGELDRLLEGARQAPLSDSDYEKISTALHALVDALAKPCSTEKSSAVVGKMSPAPSRKARRAPAKTKHRMASRAGMDAMEPMRWKARGRRSQASAVKIRR